MRVISTRARIAMAMGGLVGLITVLVTLMGRSVTLEAIEDVTPSQEQSTELDEWETRLTRDVAGASAKSVWSLVAAAAEDLPSDLAVLAVDTAGGLRIAKPQSWATARIDWDGTELILERTLRDESTVINLLGGLPLEAKGTEVGRLFLFEEPRSPTSRSNRQWIVLATTAIFLGMAASWFLAGSLTRPLRELTGAARQLAAGDRSIRVTPGRADEVGELAEAFNELASSLSCLERARRRMVSDTAHELRTPLTRLRCQLEGVEDGLLTPDASWIGGMGADLADLQSLVDDLQDLALAESGQLALELQTIELQSSLATLADSYQSRQIVNTSGPGDAQIRADPTRFRQILGNLLDNAAKWSPKGGLVTIKWWPTSTQSGRFWTIEVEDQGPGLSPEQQRSVFERLYRTEPSRARDLGGSGLGLAIVRRLAEAQGGSAGVESEVGTGSRFWVQLPAASSSVD